MNRDTAGVGGAESMVARLSAKWASPIKTSDGEMVQEPVAEVIAGDFGLDLRTDREMR